MPGEIKQPDGYLCIGGPYAGRRVATMRDHPRFRVAVRPPVAEGVVSDNPIPPITTVTYVIDCIQQSGTTGDGFVHRFWRPEDQPLSETLHILLEAYAKGARS